jgi:DNA-binding MarR family transcriptional regulator
MLRSGIAMARVFHEVGAEIGRAPPASFMIALMSIALKPGISVGELAKQMDMQMASASRVLLELSTPDPSHRRAGFGYGLIEYKGKDDDRRSKAVYLTPQGKKVIRKVLRSLGAKEPKI